MSSSKLSENKKLNILFVCLGNICRSPLAEAVFLDVLEKRNLKDSFDKIDSAGTGAYHEGECADPRTIAVCEKHGVKVPSIARQIEEDDFRVFDYILAMDNQNLKSLNYRSPRNSKAILRLFGSYDDDKAIKDPYYGGDHGFDNAYQQCLRYTNAFLAEVLPESKSES